MDTKELLQHLLVLDLETVPMVGNYTEMPERIRKEWERKAAKYDPETPAEEQFFDRAALQAEFCKIIVIGMGYFHFQKNKPFSFRVKALHGEDEQSLLLELKKLIEERFKPDELRLLAHNGREFDFPFIARRMLVNDIPLPPPLQIMYRKPWEIPHLDTMQMWRLGQPRHYISLELLGALLGVPSSKTDMDGSQVRQVFYEHGNLDRIVEYCKKDVVATARVFMRLHGLPLMEDGQVIML